MKKFIVIIFCLPILFAGCTKDNATISLTFKKGTAVYADIEEIRNVELVSAPRIIENAGKLFIGENYILIGENGKGIHVLDNTDPSNPVNIMFLQLPFTKEFFVDNDMIYAESQYDFIKIDLSDINNPVMVDRVEYAFAEPIQNADGLVLVGFSYETVTRSFKTDSEEAEELRDSYYLYCDYNNSVIPASSVPSSFVGSERGVKGTVNKIAVYSNHVYVVSNSKLHTFQDSPSNIMLVGSTDIGWDNETIYSEGNHLFIGTQSSMIVMDVTNPSSPIETSTYNHPNSCDPVLPIGNIAYLTLRTADFTGCSGDENTLEVLDISNINSPEKITSIPMTSPYGMTMINNNLYVGEGTNGMAIFDAVDPANPILINSNTSIVAYDVIEHPSIPNRILTTSDFGLSQYEVNAATMETIFLSEIAY
jgi:hypothetical protein